MSGNKGHWRTATVYNLLGSKLRNGRLINCNFLRVTGGKLADPGAVGSPPPTLHPHSVERLSPSRSCAVGLAPGPVGSGSSGIGMGVVLPINGGGISHAFNNH